ncbi:MAG: polyphosphate polymerase domain-containing protein [Clostridium sp.]|nr:polyphosphate polymerase domain-containing protein [Clostridium sp.]MCM1443883.1 polyphosphate polymerase domain-containing protein [Candidatus Amulumruptor caecigallinarius]
MEIKKRKYRHELKFIINKNMAQILKQRLSLIMDIDQNSVNEDNTYLIRSLYFDDSDSSAYYEKLDGILYRKKYRIRVYNNDTSFIRLERKLKHNNMTSKDQIKIDIDTCNKILQNNVNNIKINEDLNKKVKSCKMELNSKNDLLQDFIYEIKHKGLKPSIIVDYKRLAYTYPVSDVRITFDENLKSGLYNYNLFDSNMITYDVLEPNEVVLEVKFNEILPESIAIILQTVPMYRLAVSKFANCRELK